ncbi:cell envelope biogenesis protein AsmA [Falsochrobactrum shanghaiense]|uniref:Cell envelope biogenesis protein AsmA n=1 Tax=Falsochrobactrum shanghaiense TaxID=2201899 RepID=A0A316J5P3_9HYPH|nr:AsmA family protein [Falsochrobactrum shanghaiense]PWL16984.1 cell envelope biogenesis protein AsmA [Falsochrobactrum shanghaiense]
MGRIFVIVGGLLVLLLTAALVVPPFVDWSGYRAEFEREAGHILGRPVKVTGDVNVRLLPFPSLAFSDVRVGADPENPVMSVDTFSMDAELMPFLRGQLLIYDMRVEHPHINIALDKEGRVDWAFRPSSPIAPSRIKVERLAIDDGTVTLRDEASGRIHKATALNAVLSASKLSGPWRANGTVDILGRRLALDASSGEAKPDGSLRMRLRVSPQSVPAVFETDGDMKLDDGRLNYAGDFSLRSADALGNKKPDATVEKPFFSDVRVNGKFKADRDHFEAREFRMEQGPGDNPYVVNGKALIDYGDAARFEISADGQQIFWGPSENIQQQEPVAPMPLAERIALAHGMLEQLPIPDIPGSVDLRLPAVIAGGTTIREVTISAEPDGNGWNIRQFAADLPGRTKVEARGRLSVGSDFGFMGEMLVASRQPSGLVSWLNERVDDSIRRLESAGVSGKVDLRSGMQRVDDLEIVLDQTSFKGSFLREVVGSAEPAIDLDLNGGAVNSDALKAFTGFFTSGEGISLLEGQTLGIALKAGPVQYEDMEAENVDLAVRISNGRFDFDRLMINNVAGATLTATGAYEPFAAAPSGSLDATLLSDDLAHFIILMAHRHPQVPLFRSLSARADNYAGLFEDSEINIIANAVAPPKAETDDANAVNGTGDGGKAARSKNGPEKAAANGGEVSFSLSGRAGGMKLDLSGTSSGGGAENDPMQMQLNGTATSDNGETVLALLGLPALPLGLVGELTADVVMQGAPSAGMRTQLKLTAPDGTAVADGILSLAGGDVAASGKAQVNAADLQPFIATAGYVLPGFGQGLSADLTSDFQFAKGFLRFPNFSGKLGEENVSARIEANFADSGMPQLKGEAKLETLDMTSLVAIMLGQDALAPVKGKTGSIWPDGTFATRPSLPLLIDMKLNVAQAQMGRFGTIKDFSSRLQKGMDSLGVSELTGNWGGGYLVGTVSLRNNERVALLSSDMKWSGANLAEVYRPADSAAPFDGTLKAALTLNGSGDSLADLVASLAGSGSIEAENLIVNGLDETAYPDMLAAADALGDRPDGARAPEAAQFAAIAQQATGAGHFNGGNTRFDFTVAGGVARLAPFELNNANAALTGEAQLDLSTLGLNGGGIFSFRDGEAAQPGNEPYVRYLLAGDYDEPQIEFEHQPLVQYLTQRALEREQERVEAMQASIMEKQNLRRQLDLLSADAAERERALQEEEARRRADAQARAEAARKAEEEERQRALEAEESGAAPAEQLPPLAGQEGQSLDDFLKTLEQPPESLPNILP